LTGKMSKIFLFLSCQYFVIYQGSKEYRRIEPCHGCVFRQGFCQIKYLVSIYYEGFLEFICNCRKILAQKMLLEKNKRLYVKNFSHRTIRRVSRTNCIKNKKYNIRNILHDNYDQRKSILFTGPQRGGA